MGLREAMGAWRREGLEMESGELKIGDPERYWGDRYVSAGPDDGKYRRLSCSACERQIGERPYYLRERDNRVTCQLCVEKGRKG